jgi:hypothetical protein
MSAGAAETAGAETRQALSPDAEVKQTAIGRNRPNEQDTQITPRMRLVFVLGVRGNELDAAFNSTRAFAGLPD